MLYLVTQGGYTLFNYGFRDVQDEHFNCLTGRANLMTFLLT